MITSVNVYTVNLSNMLRCTVNLARFTQSHYDQLPVFLQLYMYKTHSEGSLLVFLNGFSPHRPGLRVIEGGVWIQVIEVFCSVLSDTQVPDSRPGFGVKFCAGHICLICVLVFISITVVTVQGVLEGREVCVPN